MKYEKIIQSLRQQVFHNYDVSEDLGNRTTNLINNIKRHLKIREVKEKYKNVSFVSKGKRKSFVARDGQEEVLLGKKSTKKGESK